MEALFLDALIFLFIAVIAVPIARRLGLGSVLGYLLSGFLAGPVLGLVSSDTAELMGFVELGVVMMLFLIGLELQPRSLWEMRSRLLGLGGLQVFLTTVAIALAAKFVMGANWNYAIACGLILALSSTAIVLQTLEEKGLLKSYGGQSSFSVLLFQDIIVIPILALLPLLASSELSSVGHGEVAHHLDFNLVHGLPGWQIAIITVSAIAVVVIGGHFLSRPLFRYIATANLREVFTAAALLLVLSITALMSLVGLSPALGAFLAGVVLANSEFRRELESNIEPFKGILLALFFITIGASIDFEIIYDNAYILALSTVGLILLKAMVLFFIANIFGIKAHSDRWLFTLSLAQAGEFGFVLLAFATQNAVLPAELSNLLIVVVALSMLLTPLVFLFYEKVIQPYLDGREAAKDEDDYDKSNIQKGTAIIAGHGRFGQVVDRILLANGYQTTVLEYKADAIDRLRKFGVQTFYGDAVRLDLLKAAGIAEAKIFVVAIDDVDKAIDLVKLVRKERPKIHIIARAWDRRHVFQLYQAGANDIVREVFDSSVRAGRYALEALGIASKTAEKKADIFIEHDREGVRKLAQVWDPDVPMHDDKKFVAMAHELRDDIELAMQSDSDLQEQLDKSAAKAKKAKSKRTKKTDKTSVKNTKKNTSKNTKKK